MKSQDDNDDDVCVCVFEHVAHVGEKRTKFLIGNPQCTPFEMFGMWVKKLSLEKCVVIVWNLCVMLGMCQCCGEINPLAPELLFFFLILAYPVYKM